MSISAKKKKKCLSDLLIAIESLIKLLICFTQVEKHKYFGSQAFFGAILSENHSWILSN